MRAQLRLLSLTPPEGIRVTDLASRLRMTKQALGEFAHALEAKGLLESVGDHATSGCATPPAPHPSGSRSPARSPPPSTT
jgi:hypothetical protein